MGSLDRLKRTLMEQEQTISEPENPTAPANPPQEEPCSEPEPSSILSRLKRNVVDRDVTIDSSLPTQGDDPDLEVLRKREEILIEEYGNRLRFVGKAGFFGSRVVFWLCMLLGGLLAFYMYMEALALWETVASFPVWLQVPAAGIFGILLLVVAYSALRLTHMYFSMKANHQIQIREISDREEFQSRVHSDTIDQESRKLFETLYSFLQNYPKRELSQRLQAYGKTNGSCWTEFQNEMTKLCISPDDKNPKGYSNRKEWVRGYQRFQEYLDDYANERLVSIAKIVAVKTAISPYPMWDMLIVLYWSFQFLSELCQVYHLRIDNYGTARLLLELWGTLFCSAQIDNMEEYAQAGVEQLLSGVLSSGFIKIAVGEASSKAASGLANYYLFLRLGRQAIRRIQPLVVEK